MTAQNRAEVCYTVAGLCIAAAAVRLFDLGAAEAWALVAAVGLWWIGRRQEKRYTSERRAYLDAMAGVTLGEEGQPMKIDPLGSVSADEIPVKIKVYKHPMHPR